MRSTVSLALVAALIACTTKSSSSADSTKAMAQDSSNPATASNDDAARDAIGAIRSGWKAAADKKDSAAIAAYYEDDAVMATSDGPVVTGKADIEKSLGRAVNLTKVNSIDSKQLVVMGDNAYDYGTFDQDAPDAKGKMTKQTGYYIVTLHRQADGSWKINHHVATTPPKM
jgi:uncharacterized protein (TIGR02246 family)